MTRAAQRFTAEAIGILLCVMCHFATTDLLLRPTYAEHIRAGAGVSQRLDLQSCRCVAMHANFSFATR